MARIERTKSPWGSITPTAMPQFNSCTAKLAIKRDLPEPVVPVINLCACNAFPCKLIGENGGYVCVPNIRRTDRGVFIAVPFSFQAAWVSHQGCCNTSLISG